VSLDPGSGYVSLTKGSYSLAQGQGSVSDHGYLVQGKTDVVPWSVVRPWSLVTGTWFLDPGSGFVSLTKGSCSLAQGQG